MNHDLINRIYHYSHMTCTGCIISPLEENKVSGLYIPGTDSCRCILPSVCCKPSIVPTITAMIDDIAYKTGAVKTSRWTRTAPYIRVAKILLSFIQHVCKLLICEIFCRNIIVLILFRHSRICVRIIAKYIRLISPHFKKYCIAPLLLFA